MVVMTKRENYSHGGIKNDESKASLSHKCGSPEGTLHGRMKELHEFHLFVDTIENDIGLHRKKAKLCEDLDVDECLYKLFLQKHSESPCKESNFESSSS
jgi:hypothetical protein